MTGVPVHPQMLRWARERSQKPLDLLTQRLLELPKASSGGGDFFASLGVRVGKSLAHAVVLSALESRTTFTEAFRLLGIKKLSTFDTLARRLGVEPS